jgi:hypothetical protein
MIESENDQFVSQKSTHPSEQPHSDTEASEPQDHSLNAQADIRPSTTQLPEPAAPVATSAVKVEKPVRSKATRKATAPAKTKTISKKPKVVGTVKCPFCARTFKAFQALGGHTSKAHPGESKVYKAKMERRDERSDAREILKQAKTIYLEQQRSVSLTDIQARAKI